MKLVSNLLNGKVGSSEQYFGLCRNFLGNPVVCSKSRNFLKDDRKVLGAYAHLV